ncbi:uncharacterized protein STEHIDRAFT_152794 [Stereum hirsutum FP-91666 SS1]|uniref:uncharacterized protein n=1 Tax=Stereum hirsutum (strain FP-91666) TaxID=721885 RepID=UPI0004410133|nr:uncharacterized protein STEHIDRAFT_152794 [Stereum hirsutum FP-91666 SS1]EIM91129.1 hypothetical protein STEHIDRAFT_152794 [Stereum hirsutum FP-91666 SS1]
MNHTSYTQYDQGTWDWALQNLLETFGPQPSASVPQIPQHTMQQATMRHVYPPASSQATTTQQLNGACPNYYDAQPQFAYPFVPQDNLPSLMQPHSTNAHTNINNSDWNFNFTFPSYLANPCSSQAPLPRQTKPLPRRVAAMEPEMPHLAPQAPPVSSEPFRPPGFMFAPSNPRPATPGQRASPGGMRSDTTASSAAAHRTPSPGSSSVPSSNIPPETSTPPAVHETSSEDAASLEALLRFAASVRAEAAAKKKSTSSRKRKAPQQDAPTKKKTKTGTSKSVSNTTRKTASVVQQQHQISAERPEGREVPTPEEPLPLNPSGATGPIPHTDDQVAQTSTPPDQKLRCPIPGCYEKKPKIYNRDLDVYRHICTVNRHKAERAKPGWEKRWGIPDDYHGKLVACPYTSCEENCEGREIRRDRLNKHMRREHGMDLEEWRCRVRVLTRRMKKAGTWTEEDATRKYWKYEEEVDNFQYLPSD